MRNLQVIWRRGGGIPKLREDVAAICAVNSSRTAKSQQDGRYGDTLPGQSDRRAECLLESQIRDMQNRNHAPHGAKDVSQAPPREPLIEPARRRVALGLIFNDVIRRENLVLDPKRSNARLDEMWVHTATPRP